MKSNPAAIALVLLVIAICLYLGVNNPLSATLIKTRSQLTNKEIHLATIELNFHQRDDFKSRIAALEQKNEKSRATWLSPLLNSYAMRVKSLVDTLATECGLENVEYEEGSLRALPVPKERLPDHRTARRSVRIKARADYAAAASFLLRAEKELPLLTCQSLSIQPPQNASPDKQDVVFVFEWPGEGEVIK